MPGKLARNLDCAVAIQQLLTNHEHGQSEFELMGKEPERENLEELNAEDRDHKLKKLRQRTLGNVEFIGELFKKQMVGLEELEGLVNKLLDTSPGDESRSCAGLHGCADVTSLQGAFLRGSGVAGRAGGCVVLF